MTRAHLSLSARALLLTASAALACPAMAETDAMPASAALAIPVARICNECNKIAIICRPAIKCISGLSIAAFFLKTDRY